MGLKEITYFVVAAVAAGLIGAEAESRAPKLAELLRQLALRFYKGALRERLDEEWSAHLAETHGVLSKLVAALGFCWAGLSMKASSSASRVSRRVYGAIAVWLMVVAAYAMQRATERLEKKPTRYPNMVEKALYDFSHYSAAESRKMMIKLYGEKTISDVEAEISRELDEEDLGEVDREDTD